VIRSLISTDHLVFELYAGEYNNIFGKKKSKTALRHGRVVADSINSSLSSLREELGL